MSGRPSSPPGKPSSVTASGSSSAPASTPSSLNRLSNESWISRSRERILALPPPGSTASGSSSSSSSPVSDYFLWKLYNLVEDRNTDGVISWNDDGSGFIISQPSLFEKDLLPNHFFIHKTFSAFVRQLTVVLGFVKAGGDRWEFFRNDFRRRRPMFDSTDLVTSRKVDQSGSSDEEPLSLTDESLDGYEYLMQGLEENIGSDGTREYYYSCRAPLCFARKLVTTDLDGKIAGVTYDGRHTHVRPRFPLHCPLPRPAIQLPRSKMVEEVEKEHMFDMVVTPSDVGKLNRLVIPKHHAEKYFPLDVSSNEQGLLLNFEDSNGKPWRFRYSYWNSSQSYVMTKGWSRFVKEKNLDAGDIISFQRGAGEDSRNRLFIDRKRHPTIGTHPDFPMAHHLDLDGNVDDVTYGGHHSHHPKPQPDRVPNQNTSLQPVSEQSCVTTEADEIETAYNKDKAREVVLKRSVAKRSKEGEDDEEQQLDHKSSTFSSVMDDTFKGDSLLNIVSSLEPLFRRVVREEVQHNLSKLDLVPLAGRSSANRIEGTDGRNLQLHFRTDFSSTLFTEAKVEGEHDDAVHIVLLDANSGHVVTSGPESSIKLDVVALDGDFQYEDDEDWTQKEFQTHVVNQREGWRPLLTGDLQVTLKEGVGTLGDLAFTDNSSWIRSRKLRLGLKVASGFFEGIRIREARTQAFIVKDHRGGLYKKHYPPLLNDEVWRLEKIGKDGVFHNRLNNHKIFTIKNFLRLMARDSAKLQNILGSGMSGRSWDALQNHAKTCVLDEKINAEEYFPVGSLLDEHIDTMVKKAYGNRNDVEYDGKSQLSLKQSKGSSGSDDDYQGLANIDEVQGAHTVGSTGRKNRHSKVWTAKGIRDRCIRLSVHTAIRFYNLQDRLGYYQPSKAVEWLIKAAKTAVDQLAVLCEPSAISATETQSAVASQPPQCREDEPQKSQKQQEPQQSGCGSSWDSNSPIDSLTWPQLYLSTGHDPTLIPFTCKTMDPQGTRPRLTFLQEPVRIKEVHDVHIFGPTESKDGHSMVQTAGGIRDRRVRLSVHAAILLYDIQDRLGYDRPSKAINWLMEKSDAAINVLDELSTAAATTKTQSAATNQPPQLNEVEPQKSQQQELRQSGCGSGWDLNSPVEFLTFQHQLDPSAVHLPGSSFIQPSLDSDAIADTIKSFFPMSSSSSGRGSEMKPYQNLFQSHPIPSLLKYIKEIQDMRLCVSGITNIDLGADSLTRFFGMSKLKVHNLFCKVPKSLPSFFQADNFVELHLPHYNHRLLWAGKLGLVNLQLINLKHSSKLISLPDLSMAQKIVHLNLRGCVKLIQVSYIRNLTMLEKLNLRNCEHIKVLPSLMGLQNLKEFYLSGCTNLRELPPSIIALNSLVVLDLKNCARLYELPMITSVLPSLQKLNISGCTNILRSLDMKGNRESHRSYGRFLSSTISGRHGYERDSQFVEEATAPKPKKRTTKKAKKISSLEVVQVEIIEEKDLRTKNINWIANMEKEERKRKSVESASTICKEVRVKRTCNSSDDFVASICQPSHEAVEKAILDSGSKLIGDTEPAPVDRAPNLTENTLSGLAIEDSTSGGGEDVGLGIQMQPEAISLCNSSDHPGKECTGRVPLDVSKTAAPCDPHKLAEKSCDGGMESNTEVFNHQPKETKPLSSYKENDEIDWLKNEIQKLQKQLEASEKRRDGFRECYDSLESELWPLRAELEVKRVNLTEQKQKHEESELEASIAWEDLKELVAQTIF